MASFNKLKARKKGPLGGAVPPGIADTPSFITQPETLDVPNVESNSSPVPSALPAATAPSDITARQNDRAQVTTPKVQKQSDNGYLRQQGGRGRKTGRTSTFATRSTEEFINRFNKHCEITRLNKNVFLEKLLDVWEERYGQPGSYSFTPLKNANQAR